MRIIFEQVAEVVEVALDVVVFQFRETLAADFR